MGVIGCIPGCNDPCGSSPNHPAILNLVAGLDEVKGMAGPWHPGSGTALRVTARCHYRKRRLSTRIEGSNLSDHELERLLSNLDIKSFATRDEQEVSGYAET